MDEVALLRPQMTGLLQVRLGVDGDRLEVLAFVDFIVLPTLLLGWFVREILRRILESDSAFFFKLLFLGKFNFLGEHVFVF